MKFSASFAFLDINTALLRLYPPALFQVTPEFVNKHLVITFLNPLGTGPNTDEILTTHCCNVYKMTNML